MNVIATSIAVRTLRVLVTLGVICAPAQPLSAASSVLPNDLPDGRQVVHRPAGEIKITWQALTPSSGVVFRVYRGSVLSRLELFYEVAAVPGRSHYEVGDFPQSGGQMYELRIAHVGEEGGGEVTLKRVSVLLVEFLTRDSVLESLPRCSACRSLVSRLSDGRLVSRAWEPETWAPEPVANGPTVPPPRSA